MIAWLQIFNANHNQPGGGEQNITKQKKPKQQSEKEWQVPGEGK